MHVSRVTTALLGCLLVATFSAACGTAAPQASQSTSSPASSASAPVGPITVAALAPKASSLCSKTPTNAPLTLRMDTPGAPAVNPGDVGLQAINESGSGLDGPYTLSSVDNVNVVEPVPGNGANGPFDYGELYFSANGAVPASVTNVELCAEVYDAASGDVLTAEFSGTNPAGAVAGAYDAAPQAYSTSGTKKWYTISFNFSGIAFQAGGAGIGKENGSADFRINLGPPIVQGAVYFKRVWLVTQNVPSEASQPAPPGGSSAVPLSGAAPSSSSTATSGTSTAPAGPVPTLTLAPLSSAPSVSGFTGSCSGLGFGSSSTSSFSSATITSKSGHPYTEKTTFWVGFTPTDFYYCAQIQSADVHAAGSTSGDATWGADDMEFWLAPTNDRAAVRGTDTYQLLFNALGGWNNAQGTGTVGSFNFTWASNAQHKVVVQGTVNGGYGKTTGWSVLAAVPWSSLGLTAAPASGTEMGFNTGGCIGVGCTATTDWVPGLNLNNWHTPSLWAELKVS